MKTSLIRANALACALYASTALSSPAIAQTEKSIAPPAEKLAITPGGVDMRTGKYAFSQTDLSIGGEGESGGLALTRTMSPAVPGHINPFANFSHNWDVMLTEKRVDIFQKSFSHGSGTDYRISVHFGGRSETFDGYNSQSHFELVSKNGLAKLTYSGDRNGTGVVYSFQASDGTLAVFRPLGGSDCGGLLRCAYVSEIIQADGTRFSFGYEVNSGAADNRARLRSITSTRGYALLLEYGAAAGWNYVTKACVLNLSQTVKPTSNICPAGAPASSYGYAGFGASAKMTSAVEPGGATWGYSHGAGTTAFLKPGQSVPWLTNSIVEQTNGEGAVEELVVGQSFADGRSYSYFYDYTPLVEGQVSTVAGGYYEDNQGNRTTVRFDFPLHPDSYYGDVSEGGIDDPGTLIYQLTPGPVEIIDPLGRSTTSDYCDPNAMANLPPHEHQRCIVSTLQSFTDPEGNRTELLWDLYERNILRVTRKAKPGSGLPDLVTSATYDCLNRPKSCAKPVTTTDAKGNVTEFTYSPDHGGVLTETGPAVNGVRPQKRYSYTQRYAWIANGSGGYAQAAAPVWLLTGESFCKTSAATGNPAAPCAVAGDEVRTTYEYGPDAGPNNLLLRGIVVDAGGLNLRTCYAYDALGNRIAETKPKAGLSTCN